MRQSRRIEPISNGIDIEEHMRLMNRLLSKPVTVLRHFRACGIGYLSELSSWETLKTTSPEGALVVRNVAALMGIPERPEVKP